MWPHPEIVDPERAAAPSTPHRSRSTITPGTMITPGRGGPAGPVRGPTPLDVGLGARAILTSPGSGEVVGVYRVAAYLRFPSGLVALTSGLAPRGPLHLRVAVLPSMRIGDRVHIDGADLRGPGWTVSLHVPTWRGSLPPPADRHTPPGGRTEGRTCVRAREPVCEAVCRPESGYRAVDLGALAARLGGRGPGLTPAGDDVLAGAVLGTRAARGPAAEPELLAVTASVRTTEVAAAFLHWTARGQCIEPAHDWLTAADDAARVRVERRLLAVGASSGAALLAGLRLSPLRHP